MKHEEYREHEITSMVSNILSEHKHRLNEKILKLTIVCADLEQEIVQNMYACK